jgi:ferric-dicitrate binding protein FerR (iron transport regulator)
MSFREEDLRTALEALRGDPLESAERVLAELPAVPATPLAKHSPLWLTAAGVAAGLAAGALIGWLAGPRTARSPEVAVETPSVPPPVDEARAARLAFLIGDAKVETDAGVRVARVGELVPFDAFVSTSPDGMAALGLPCGSDLRLGKGGRLSLAEHTISLERGAIWTKVEPAHGRLTVDTTEGSVVAREATFVVIAAPSRTDVGVLDGAVTFTTPMGETRDLAAHQTCKADGGRVSPAVKIEDLFGWMEWQEPLLMAAGRQSELYDALYGVVLDLGRPERRQAAERTLRTRPHLAAGELSYVLNEADPQAPFWQPAAALLCDLADRHSLNGLFGILLAEVPDLRGDAAAAIQRVTGWKLEQDAEFWRTADYATRFDVVSRLRRKLADF